MPRTLLTSSRTPRSAGASTGTGLTLYRETTPHEGFAILLAVGRAIPAALLRRHVERRRTVPEGRVRSRMRIVRSPRIDPLPPVHGTLQRDDLARPGERAGGRLDDASRGHLPRCHPVPRRGASEHPDVRRRDVAPSRGPARNASDSRSSSRTTPALASPWSRNRRRSRSADHPVDVGAARRARGERPWSASTRASPRLDPPHLSNRIGRAGRAGTDRRRAQVAR